MKTPILLSLDRFEGDAPGFAVLVDDDGDSITVPRAFVPHEARPGDVLTFSLEVDQAATQALAKRTREVQDRLSKRDPGGDVAL